MKVVAVAQLMGEDRKPIEPGTEINLPDAEAKSLLDRCLVALPEGAKKKVAEKEGSGES